MMVRDVMTTQPEVLDADATIRAAAQLMRDHDYGVVPIIDAESSLVGIVTDRDIVIRALADGHGPETPLREVMTANPDTIPQDVTVEQALQIMSSRQIRRVPVVEFGRLIGILSLSDIASSQAPATEKAKVLEDVSAGGSEFRTGVEPPES